MSLEMDFNFPFVLGAFLRFLRGVSTTTRSLMGSIVLDKGSDFIIFDDVVGLGDLESLSVHLFKPGVHASFDIFDITFDNFEKLLGHRRL